MLLLLVERRRRPRAARSCRRCARARSRPCAPRRTARGTRPCGSPPCARAASTFVFVGQLSSSSTISAAERAATGAAALVAALLAGARVEHAQVVVDLGDRADRRARVRRRRLLLDRDRRRQAADLLVLRLLHLAEELPRVRRQRLDVAALALGVQRVERERRLARARDAGEHDQLALGQAQLVDRQVVLARARTMMNSGSSAPRRICSVELAVGGVFLTGRAV